jgi:hypothetical protein
MSEASEFHTSMLLIANTVTTFFTETLVYFELDSLENAAGSIPRSHRILSKQHQSIIGP